MKPTFCRLRDPERMQLPMPGETRLFEARGETVDTEHPFWSRCLADGDIVIAVEETAKDTTKRKGE